MVNVILLGIRTDYQTGYSDAQAILVDLWRRDMVIESSPVIPANENGRGIPVGALHYGINQSGNIGHPFPYSSRRVFAHCSWKE